MYCFSLVNKVSGVQSTQSQLERSGPKMASKLFTYQGLVLQMASQGDLDLLVKSSFHLFLPNDEL